MSWELLSFDGIELEGSSVDSSGRELEDSCQFQDSKKVSIHILVELVVRAIAVMVGWPGSCVYMLNLYSPPI